MFCNIDVDNTGIMPSFSFSHIFDQRPVLCFGVKLDNFIKKSNSPSRIIYTPCIKKLCIYINLLNWAISIVPVMNILLLIDIPTKSIRPIGSVFSDMVHDAPLLRSAILLNQDIHQSILPLPSRPWKLIQEELCSN